MKWVKRGLWTAAWGVWAWCGFGLARELPRELGPAVGKLQASELHLREPPEVGTEGEITNADGTLLWKSSRHEKLMRAHDDDAFLVKENWTELWKDWFPNLKYETNTLRSLNGGSFMYRTPGWIIVYPMQANAIGSFVALPDGTCFRLPLKRNYPLIIFCHTILALPLIFLWSLLRWRRNRRLRLASVQS